MGLGRRESDLAVAWPTATVIYQRPAIMSARVCIISPNIKCARPGSVQGCLPWTERSSASPPTSPTPLLTGVRIVGRHNHVPRCDSRAF